jgi:uncharacterized surface protein with fasciclin (FAS1) repeats
MNTLLRTRTISLAALALTASMGLAACGSDDTSSDNASDSDTTTSAPMESDSSSPSDSMSESPTDDAMAQTVGASCDAIPTDPSDPGSFQGMATEPVATAASANPLLKTLVKAVTEAGLVDTLNSAQGITVFAPTDDAFAAIPKKQLKAVLKDKATLTKILTHHVVPEQLAPEDIDGEHETLNKDMVNVMGSGDDITVEGATVLCGNIPTANATVYVIDQVLMPKM